MDYSCGNGKQAGETAEHRGVGEGSTSSMPGCYHSRHCRYWKHRVTHTREVTCGVKSREVFPKSSNLVFCLKNILFRWGGSNVSQVRGNGEGSWKGIVDGQSHSWGIGQPRVRAYTWLVLQSIGQVETCHPWHPTHKGAPFGSCSAFFFNCLY